MQSRVKIKTYLARLFAIFDMFYPVDVSRVYNNLSYYSMFIHAVIRFFFGEGGRDWDIK